MIATSPAGNFEFLNGAALDFFGKTPEALSTWTTSGIVYPNDLPALSEAFAISVTTGQPRDSIAVCDVFDGVYRSFQGRALPFRNAGSSILNWYFLLTDVEDRRRTASEGWLRSIIDTIPGLVWSASPDGTVDFLNQAWFDYTGVGLEESGGSGWEKTIHPEDAERLTAYWASLLASGQPGESDARFRRFDGNYRWFLIRAVPLHDETGGIVKWYGLNTDVEDRKGSRRLLEMVASGTALTVILEGLCRYVETTISGCCCSVLLVDPTRTHLQHMAGPSFPATFNASVHGLPLSASSGPCATTVYLNEQVIAADITLDAQREECAWCRMAVANGLKACWYTPISSTGGTVIGIIAIYYTEPKSPTPLHQSLIGQFTHIASIAIERSQNEAELKRSEAFLAKAQQLSSTRSFSWRVATGEITWSEQTYRIFELDPSSTVTLELIASRVHPDDMPSMRDIVRHSGQHTADQPHS